MRSAPPACNLSITGLGKYLRLMNDRFDYSVFPKQNSFCLTPIKFIFSHKISYWNFHLFCFSPTYIEVSGLVITLLLRRLLSGFFSLVCCKNSRRWNPVGRHATYQSIGGNCVRLRNQKQPRDGLPAPGDDNEERKRELVACRKRKSINRVVARW